MYCNVIRQKKDGDGRVLSLTFEIDGTMFNLLNLYAPNSDRPDFYASLSDYIDDKCENTIICGDFNITLNPQMDRCNTQQNKSKSISVLTELMHNYFLTDIWRIRNPTEKQFTWSNVSQNKHSRIDFFLISQGLEAYVDNHMFLPGIQTDHRAVLITVSTATCDRGPGYWKFNNTYLDNNEFCQTIKKEIRNTCASFSGDHVQIWEKIKERVKNTTRNFARNNVSEERLIESRLVEYIQESNQPLNKNDSDLLLKTKADLDEILIKKTAGVLFRCKCRWYELGEKNSSYFYNLEKRRAAAKNCNCLITDTGQQINDIEKILHEQHLFYSELYAENKDVNFSLINETGIQVPDEVKKMQDRELTIDDITQAVQQLSKNKSPGSDCLTLEFYLHFWQLLKYPLYNAFLLSYENKKLYKSARSGILNLIPKPNKDL